MTYSLVNDLGREDEILQDGIMNRGQSSGARTFLELDGVVLCGLGEDTPLSDNNDVLAELLLELRDY